MTSMIRSLSPFALIACIGLAAPATFAQNGSPPGSHSTDASPPQRTEPPVTDSRGQTDDAITPTPSEAIGPTKFTELDSNGDHKISREEAALDSLIAANFAELDADRDGSISLPEYRAGQNNQTGKPQRVSEK